MQSAEQLRQAETKPDSDVKQMVHEAQQMMVNVGKGPLLDGALILAGNQVEHFETASYGSLRDFAQSLNN